MPWGGWVEKLRLHKLLFLVMAREASEAFGWNCRFWE